LRVARHRVDATFDAAAAVVLWDASLDALLSGVMYAGSTILSIANHLLANGGPLLEIFRQNEKWSCSKEEGGRDPYLGF